MTGPSGVGEVHWLADGSLMPYLIEFENQPAAQGAAAVIAWGNCASFGCVQAAKPNPTDATPLHKIIGKPVINVPGCPPKPEAIAFVLKELLDGRKPDLTGQVKFG